jgi:protein involved in ribonucleotide reduction
MLIAYASRTGNVRRFVQKLGFKAVKIEDSLQLDEPFVLVTYTTGFGQVPEQVESFVQKNRSRMLGVAASGNRNWGANFAKSAELISTRYGVPVISKFELSGTNGDIQTFKERVQSIVAN